MAATAGASPVALAAAVAGAGDARLPAPEARREARLAARPNALSSTMGPCPWAWAGQAAALATASAAGARPPSRAQARHRLPGDRWGRAKGAQPA
jgi:hypothetical protein